MEGIRFYADAGEQRSKSASKKHVAFTRANLRKWANEGVLCNCIALFEGSEHMCHDGAQEALVGLTDCSNAAVCSSAVSREYLRKHCVRIDEALARRLHPLLAARLDAE
jgi:hypothetical protein